MIAQVRVGHSIVVHHNSPSLGLLAPAIFFELLEELGGDSLNDEGVSDEFLNGFLQLMETAGLSVKVPSAIVVPPSVTTPCSNTASRVYATPQNRP